MKKIKCCEYGPRINCKYVSMKIPVSYERSSLFQSVRRWRKSVDIDKQGEIITELLPIIKRESPKTPPTPENVMQFFIDRVKNNLHVILCFSPVGEKFRNRSLRFPGLISGCTIDWFQVKTLSIFAGNTIKWESTLPVSVCFCMSVSVCLSV